MNKVSKNALNRQMMTLHRRGLISCTHSYTKHNIRSRCTKVKELPNHRMIKSSIKWNTGKVLIKISLGRHGCHAWLGIFRTELHEHVLNILCLGDECSFGEL